MAHLPHDSALQTAWNARTPLAVALAGASALLLAGGAVTLSWLNVFPIGSSPGFADIEWYRRALDEVAAGRPMYSQLTYPPITLVLLSPLRGLPDLAGEQLWTGLSLAAALLLSWITARFSLPDAQPSQLLRRPDFLIRFGMTALLLLLSYPLIFNLTVGQLGIFVITLALVDASGFIARRHQGGLVGVSAALKLTPLLFFPYYLATKQWRQFILATVTFVAIGAIGFGLFPQDSAYFWTHADSSGQLATNSYINVTLLASFLRWLGDSMWTRVVWGILAVAIGGVSLLRARQHFQRGEQFQAALVVGIASTLIGPIAWAHYQVWQVVAAIWMILSGSRRNFLLGIALYTVFSYPFAAAVYGSSGVLVAAGFGRELLMLASLTICLTGLPHTVSTVEDAAASGELRQQHRG